MTARDVPEGPTGLNNTAGYPGPSPIKLSLNRSDGTLKSVDVKVASATANEIVHLDVFHVSAADVTHCVFHRSGPTGGTGATGATGATGSIFGGNATTWSYWTEKPDAKEAVVYETAVAETAARATNVPSASARWTSAWAGRLSPSDWSGGCLDGVYWLRFNVVPAGMSRAAAKKASLLYYLSGPAFRCQAGG
jgi:hypothetical protein